MEPVFGVKDFFANQSVLVTGATGFIGKAVVEKLLSSCPDLKCVYLLIRPSTSSSSNVADRLQNMLKNPLFDSLRKYNTKAFEKLFPICEDIGLDRLGMSDHDMYMITSNVSIVIHSAATVKFDETLEKSVNLNVKGLLRVISLCRDMENIKALVHVSTAYANCDQKFIEEKIYPPPNGSNDVLEAFSDGSKGIHVNKLMGFVAGCRPNTYTYTKAIAEHILSQEAGYLPVCIVRPSIVTSTIKEPLPGWIDDGSPSAGLIAGLGLGIVRVAMADVHKVINLVPVDCVANLILCAAWQTNQDSLQMTLSLHSQAEIKVYNCCTPINNGASINTFATYLKANLLEISPFYRAVAYPAAWPTTSKFLFVLMDFLLHYIPAVISAVTSKSSRSLKKYEKLQRWHSLVHYFFLNEWEFSTENTAMLFQNLNEQDRKCFFINIASINWEVYIRDFCRGIRRYVVREEVSTLSLAKERIKYLRKCYRIVTLVGVLILAGISIMICRLMVI